MKPATITPSEDVINGKNGTVAGLQALAESLQRNKVMNLYNQYGNNLFESLEDFTDRMETLYGEDWVNSFTATNHY